MSLSRYAKKRDAAEPRIVEALQAAGWLVEKLDRPVDLLCWKAGTVRLLEVKTGRGKKLTVARDKRQQAQRDFLDITQTPIVRTPEEALKAVSA